MKERSLHDGVQSEFVSFDAAEDANDGSGGGEKRRKGSREKPEGILKARSILLEDRRFEIDAEDEYEEVMNERKPRGSGLARKK